MLKISHFFTASDILSLRVIKGRRFYNRFIAENTGFPIILICPKVSINYKKEEKNLHL